MDIRVFRALYMQRATAEAMAMIPRDGIKVTTCKPGKAYGLGHGFTAYAVQGRTFTTSNAAAAQRACAVYVSSCELVKG
jgi:hypothetical protein